MCPAEEINKRSLDKFGAFSPLVAYGNRLVANRGKCFQGSIVLGKGFILSPEQADALIQRDPRNKDVLFPYLNGEDLNSRPDCSASRWVINFHDWSEEQAREYPEVFDIVERHVKPERLKNKRKVRRERWWQFAERAPSLYRSIGHLERILVVARVSRTCLPVSIPKGPVASEATVVFATDRLTDLALLSSSIHYAWASTWCSSLKGDLRYTPSDTYATMVFPEGTAAMHSAAKVLDAKRRSTMLNRKLGLTKLYNLVHDPSIYDEEVTAIRNAHQNVDAAVAEAYGWLDLDISSSFAQTRQGYRFTPHLSTRIEFVSRLLNLNHDKHAKASAMMQNEATSGWVREAVEREVEDGRLF